MSPFLARLLRWLRKFTSALATALRWQPLTARGLLAGVCAALALWYLALPQKDLVAAVLGGGLLALLGISVITCLVLRLRLSRRLEIDASFDHENPRSQSPIASGLTLKHSSIPPYFSLQLSRRFEQEGIETPLHILRGKEPTLGKRHLLDTLIFPHRGLWTLAAVRLEVRDALGFCALTWERPTSGSIEVSAPTISIQPLPIVAASSRAGDQLDQARERSGDPFDLKAYDPSDGIRRILWKTYAKSGELIVRRAEPAVIPEGEVALYLVADKNDDVVAGALQNYLDFLKRQEIQVLFGTDGIQFISENAASGDSTSSGQADVSAGDFYCTEPLDIQRAINRSVWSEAAGTGSDFPHFLESLTLSNRAVHNVIVFAAAEGTSNKQELWFSGMIKSAAVQTVKLSIALVPRKLGHGYFRSLLTGSGLTTRDQSSKEHPALRAYSAVSDYLPAQIRRKTMPHQGSGALLAEIAKSGADLHFVESYEQ